MVLVWTRAKHKDGLKLAQLGEGEGGNKMTSHDFWPSVIEKIKEELALYDAKKIWPPLRQMFYRLVAREALTNTNSMYKQLSAQTARARESGILPIDCFRDDSPIADIDDEYLSPEQTVDNYLEMLQDLPENYTGLPRWYNQPHYVEIWIEKNAIVSEFQSIINEAGLEVRLVPHGGYVSLTQLNESRRLQRRNDAANYK